LRVGSGTLTDKNKLIILPPHGYGACKSTRERPSSTCSPAGCAGSLDGTRKLERLNENLAAADVKLTADELKEIEGAAAQITDEPEIAIEAATDSDLILVDVAL